jgi:hypothetical protein
LPSDCLDLALFYGNLLRYQGRYGCADSR